MPAHPRAGVTAACARSSARQGVAFALTAILPDGLCTRTRVTTAFCHHAHAQWVATCAFYIIPRLVGAQQAVGAPVLGSTPTWTDVMLQPARTLHFPRTRRLPTYCSRVCTSGSRLLQRCARVQLPQHHTDSSPATSAGPYHSRSGTTTYLRAADSKALTRAARSAALNRHGIPSRTRIFRSASSPTLLSFTSGSPFLPLSRFRSARCKTVLR